METPTTENMPPQLVADKWRGYVIAVKERDQHRMRAEEYERKRREQWRSYYVLDKKIKEMNADLGIDEVATFKEPPPAPKKAKRMHAAVDLTS